MTDHAAKKGAEERHPYLVTTVVLVFGLVSIGILALERQISLRGEVEYRQVDAIKDLQILVAMTRFELEEGYYGGHAQKVERAKAGLEQAGAIAEAMLNGGAYGSGLVLQRLDDPQLRARTEQIKAAVSELEAFASGSYLAFNISGSPHPWDDRLAAACESLLANARALEVAVENSLTKDQAQARRLYSATLVALLFAVGVTATGVYFRERQRRLAKMQLIEVNLDLRARTAELHHHREYLSELVEERTIELQKANRELQVEVEERKHTAEALRKSQEQYRMLVETMNEGLTILDNLGLLQYANDAFCTMMGHSREDLLGRRWVDFIPSVTDRNAATERLRTVGCGKEDRYEVALNARDGRTLFAMVSLKGISGANGSLAGCFAVVTDITERIALQTRSMRAAHLASLGELAAGVAHEINSPANGVINYARILLDLNGGVSDGDARDLADRIQTEGRRIADIVKRLLLFARGGKKKMPVRLEEVLSNTLGLTASQLRNDGVEVLSSVPAGLPVMMADAQEIQQVFLNVISNARYALNQRYPGSHGKKILQIGAGSVALGEKPYVRTVFRDNGTGISADIMPRIRHPFFSTKPHSQGTGLGLSISDGIIKEHGGMLDIESVEGEFTRVTVDLPALGG